MLEFLKVLGSVLTGGLMGAVLTEWFRRRRGRVQRIPLIERVNREVSPGLRGITLARIVGGTAANRQLEELKNLREYQLTMRNSSSIHLQDAEVQFEFPAEDVQAWVERPSLSKTPLVEVDATPTAPWKKAFRWGIPHLPSGDSVEFTFRAVDPSSDAYEAALYHSGVVFERKVGEPPPRKDRFGELFHIAVLCAGIILGTMGISLTFVSRLIHKPLESASLSVPSERVRVAGCDLLVASNANNIAGSNADNHSVSWWTLTFTVVNVGPRECVVRSEGSNLISPETVEAGAIKTTTVWFFSQQKPRLVDVGMSVSSTNSSPVTTTVSIYAAP